MTLRLIDSFDAMPSGSAEEWLESDGWYASGTGHLPLMARSSSTAFDEGYSLALNTAVGNTVTVFKALGERYEEPFIMGFRCINTGGDGNIDISLYDTQSGGEQVRVRIAPLGLIEAYRITPAGSTVLLGRTISGKWTTDQWFYFEVKMSISDTAGIVEVRINTVVVLSLTAQDTHNGTPIFGQAFGFDTIRLSTSTGASRGKIDDFYALTMDGAVNDDYLGNVKARAQQPVADSLPLDFSIGGTSPALTNWQSELNSALNDTSYVYSPTAGDRDLYELGAIANAPVIYGVQLRGCYRQDDATQRVARNTLQTNLVDSEGQDHYLNQTFTFYRDLWELNPDTGVGWTGTEINALLIGPKVQV